MDRKCRSFWNWSRIGTYWVVLQTKQTSTCSGWRRGRLRAIGFWTASVHQFELGANWCLQTWNLIEGFTKKSPLSWLNDVSVFSAKTTMAIDSNCNYFQVLCGISISLIMCGSFVNLILNIFRTFWLCPRPLRYNCYFVFNFWCPDISPLHEPLTVLSLFHKSVRTASRTSSKSTFSHHL